MSIFIRNDAIDDSPFAVYAFEGTWKIGAIVHRVTDSGQSNQVNVERGIQSRAFGFAY